MKKILSRSEVISCLSLDSSSWELLALAEAEYDESESQLLVNLSAKLRAVASHNKQPPPNVDWLPVPRLQKEHMGLEEAHAASREIFSNWTAHLRTLVQGLESAPNQPLTTNT